MKRQSTISTWHKAARWVLVFLVACILNYVVAWSCMAIWPDDYLMLESVGNDTRAAEHLSRIHRAFDSGFPEPEKINAYSWGRVGWSIYCADAYGWEWPYEDEWSVPWTTTTVLEAGWPMRSIGGDFREYPDERSEYAWAVMVPRSVRHAFDKRLILWTFAPLRPLPVGFIITAILYAAAMWVSWRVVRYVVWIRRRRRTGLCPVCGYDLRGNLGGGCPECGWGREGAACKKPSRQR